jgi:cytochrome P450
VTTAPTAPRAWPFVGHAPLFLRDKLALLQGLARTGGPVAEVRLGPRRILLLCEPEDIRHVLVSNAKNYEKTRRLTEETGRSLLGRGLLTSTGAAHRPQRLLLQPLFHVRVLERFESVIRETCERAVAEWPSARELDLGRAGAAFARRVILLALAGPALADDPAFLAAVSSRQRYIEHSFLSLLPLRHRLPTRVRREYLRGDRVIRRALEDAIDARLAAPTDDLLSLMLAARYEDGSAMDRELVLDEATVLLITGFETLGDALAWTLYLVAAHPETERSLLDELDRERPAAVDDLRNCDLLQRLIAESLRLYPTTWLYVRVAQDGDVLPSGTALAAGDTLYVSPWLLHHDPSLYDEPERFDPGRFEPAAARGRPRHAYFPFGSGPRVCLGESLARMELGLAVAHLVPRLRLELAPGADPTPVPRMSLTPRRLLVRARPRDSAG